MNHYQPRCMLVTGGAGFIGANFIRYVLTEIPDIQVVNLDLLTYAGSLDNLQYLPNADRYHFIQGDINDSDLIKRVLSEHTIDTIVHFAAESHVDRSILGPAAFIQTNVVGTFTLLEAARHYWIHEKGWNSTNCRFHHISTDEVYGALTANDPPFTEETAYAPNSPYSASKAGSDHLARAYHKTYGLPVTVSHCSNNYGFYQHPEKFIPTIIRCCLEWQRIPVFGNGSPIRDWLYVEDHCRAIMAIVTKGRLGQTYNIGGDNEWENIAIAHYICHVMDELKPRQMPYKGLINFVADRPGHDFRYAVDTKKIKDELNWAPQESFTTGIEKTIAFYLKESK